MGSVRNTNNPGNNSNWNNNWIGGINEQRSVKRFNMRYSYYSLINVNVFQFYIYNNDRRYGRGINKFIRGVMINLKKLKKLILNKKSCFIVFDLYTGIKSILKLDFCGDLKVMQESWIRDNLNNLFLKKKKALRYIENLQSSATEA